MTDYEIKKLIEIRNLNVRMMGRYIRPPLVAIAIHCEEFNLIMKQQCMLDVLLQPYDEEPDLIELVLIKP